MSKEKNINLEKELEQLRKMGSAGVDLMKNLYGDLFGGILPQDSKEGQKETSDSSSEDVIPAHEALKHAEDALKEARDLMNTDMSLFKRIDEQEMQKKDGGGPIGGPIPAPEEKKPEEPEKDPIEELDSLIGLATIKHDVKELADFVRVQKMRKEQGLKSVPVSLHLVFTGNPGTGKTTVARILARLYKKIGVLSKGQLVEVDRSGLVAGYVGQTALKTQEKIKEAMGGVLFIDEAYSLAKKDDNFGEEAIDTILKAMEDHRDDLVVIVAGYTGPMEKFINSNPGLKSRFNKYFEFPDYTLDELTQMFDLNCKKYDYTTDETVRHQVRSMIALRKLTRLLNFANGREVRNLFEEIITNQARRIARMENPSHEEIMRIELEDLVDEESEKPAEDAEKSEGSEEKPEIGETVESEKPETTEKAEADNKDTTEKTDEEKPDTTDSADPEKEA